MTERGDSDRIEYSVPGNTMLSEFNGAAWQSIENILLLERQTLDSSLSYSYRDRIARRELEALYLEDDEPYEVAYVEQDGEISTVTLERAVLMTQSVVSVDHYADGDVEEAAELSILRWIDGVEHPFRTRYLLESFKGGAVLGTVSHTDITSAQGLEERRMTPYDYAELQKELQLVAVARAGLADAMLEQG